MRTKKRYLLFLFILLSITSSKGQSNNETNDSCMVSFPSIVFNPSPVYEGSSEIFGFKSEVDLDSFILIFYDSTGTQIAVSKQDRIRKNEYIELTDYVSSFIKPKDLKIKETRITILWMIEYWQTGSKEKRKCTGLIWFYLYN